MYTYLLAAIVSAALSGIGVWKVQDWRYGAKEADRVTAAREKEKLDRLVENRLSGNVIGALNEAKKREAAARDAAAAYDAANAAVWVAAFAAAKAAQMKMIAELGNPFKKERESNENKRLFEEA